MTRAHLTPLVSALLCGVFTLAVPVNLVWNLKYVRPATGFVAGLINGAAFIGWAGPTGGGVLGGGPPGLLVEPVWGTWDDRSFPWTLHATWPQATLRGPFQFISVPLWMPFLLSAGLTILGWRRMRPPAHACQRCGYNLTGNTSGVCPECGGPASRRGPNSVSRPGEAGP